ncbi:MAG: hypothetical protein AAF705_02145 [Bacteroidota bacterium]
MLLNNDQIQVIENRLIEKGAPNYQEVLMELTDDVASDIEALMEDAPALDFDTVLESSLSRYNRSTLKQLGRQKEAAIMRKYSKIEWQMVRTWFSWPKIAVTCFLTLTFGWFLTQAQEFGKPVLLSVYFTLLLLPMLQLLVRGLKRWRFNRSLPRKVLAVKIGPLTAGLFSIIPTMLYFPQVIGESFLEVNLLDYSYYWYYQAFLLVLIWICVFAIGPILEEKGREQAEALMAVSSS